MEIDIPTTSVESKDGNKRNRDQFNSDSLPSSPPSKKAQEEAIHLPTIEEECLMSVVSLNDGNDVDLKIKVTEHRQDNSPQKKDDVEIMEVDGNKTEDENVDDKLSFNELKNKMQTIVLEHEKIVSDLISKLESKQNELEIVKKKVDKLVKEEGNRKAEVKKLKAENEKISNEIGQLRYNKDIN